MSVVVMYVAPVPPLRPRKIFIRVRAHTIGFSCRRNGMRKSWRPQREGNAMNAITLLKEDHKKVRGLLAELEATTSRGIKTRTELLAKIAREIEVHTTIEEEIFYPAFKAAGEKNDDDKMYFEALEEHRAAGDLVLPDLLATDPGSECFGGRAKVLKELVEHHAGEEEKEMFPRARALLSADELTQLGARMEQRKAELMAQAVNPKSAPAKLFEAVVDAISPPADVPVPASRKATKANDGGAPRSR
jgi:hemerythrin superfamily protein